MVARRLMGVAIEGDFFRGIYRRIQVGLEAVNVGNGQLVRGRCGVLRLGGDGWIGVAEIGRLKHEHGHAGSPFHHLWTYVLHERCRGPPAQDHDFEDGVLRKEKGHGCAQSQGVCPDVLWTVPEPW
ncbi:hypothetical protein ACA910_021560 [Epithemia clementina (nom. ined.)]